MTDENEPRMGNRGIKPATFTTSGTKFIRHTDEEYEKAIIQSRGNKAEMVRLLGVSFSAIKSKLKNNPDLYALLCDLNELELHKAEMKLYEKIDAGDLSAITFFLKNKGSLLGYVNELTVKMQGNINHTNYDLTKLSEEELIKLEQLTRKLESGDSDVIQGEFIESTSD